jgi:hypothetical protein
MKHYLLILFCLQLTSSMSQTKDSVQKVVRKEQTETKTIPQTNSTRANQSYKPEILTSGFFDIVNNGQVNASARFIRLFIGEPGKFAIPLSIYSGVSSNNFQNQQSQSFTRSNDHLVTNFINPLSGLANLSVDGVLFFNKKQRLTRCGIIYHVGERILTGVRTGPVTNPQTGKPINFLNSFGVTGFYFQTGAWERNNANNVGIFWFALRYIGCYTRPSQIKEFLPSIETNGFYHGYSLGWGVEINKLVNIKVLYYKYKKKPEIDYSLPIYQFSFNYSLKN